MNPISFGIPGPFMLTGQDEAMNMMSLLRLAAALLSLAGDPDDVRLPRSLADEYYEEDAAPDDERQEDPPQDPSTPQRPKKKEDSAPRPREEPLLEHPHESIPAFFRTHFSAKAWEENVWRDYLTEPPVLVPLGLAVGA